MSTNSHRSTVAELDGRFQEVAKQLSQGITGRNIIRYARATWSISTRRARSYIAVAQARIRDDQKVERTTMVAQAVRVYQAVVDNPESKDFDRIRARARIDALYGLDAPQRLEVKADAKLTASHEISVDWKTVAQLQEQAISGALTASPNSQPEQPAPVLEESEPPPISMPAEDAPQPRAQTAWSNGEPQEEVTEAANRLAQASKLPRPVQQPAKKPRAFDASEVMRLTRAKQF